MSAARPSLRRDRQPLNRAEQDTVQAVHRAANAITRLLDDPVHRPETLYGIEYLESTRRRLRSIAEDLDVKFQKRFA